MCAVDPQATEFNRQAIRKMLQTSTRYSLSALCGSTANINFDLLLVSSDYVLIFTLILKPPVAAQNFSAQARNHQA